MDTEPGYRRNLLDGEFFVHHCLLSTIAIQAYNLEYTLGQATKGGLREMIHNEVTPSKLSSAAK